MKRFGAVVAVLLLVAAVRADSQTPPKPIYTEVYLRNAHPGAAGIVQGDEISGNLLRWDDQTATISSNGQERTVEWVKLTGGSAFALRARLIDKAKASEWFDLGKFGWGMAAREQARMALSTAVRMDASLKDQVDSVLASPAGSLIPAATQPAEAAPAEVTDGSVDPTAVYIHDPSDHTPQAYQKTTPQEDAKEIAEAHQSAEEMEKKFGLHFHTLETPHFLVFTDWDPGDDDFLKTSVEGAYTAVSAQFNLSPRGNVFVGKLPIYMLARFEDFKRVSEATDVLPRGVTKTLRGYYSGRTDGSGYMVMWKPEDKNLIEARREWAYVLTHEFTHAFVARYRSNKRIPRWLNEGIAEVIASSKFPLRDVHTYARMMALNGGDPMFLFNDRNMPDGQWYPVMQTMVETLLSHDHSAFLQFFDSIKDGMAPEQAMQKFFGVNDVGLIKAWKAYLNVR